ncbi:hypothetical protein PHYSODRAFT_338800 [Phytophthora sojae]|uniref:Uncharacterized protein n=1 Tax=Phytophthora sojae (strain P6497) TaxID=1094619 RepID=G5A370_PHYSP|nr:hypothetical protein PHYSODRAFT_338800 [Phytophthora sojae]EGZ10110.1 hypothetical protein PHYSODRAFT_338800 [Phytophthora sojae]|eukprot:XP_009534971.1 hypothetical protein PHYSODRAFT_338800 [Phytophthora sojae]
MKVEEWAFLDEWCGAMRELFASTESSATVWQWGPDYSLALRFTIVPPRTKKLTPNERLKQLKTLREGLALFAAVAWINVDALISLLKSNGVCEPREEVQHHEFMMAELPVFVELEVTSKLCSDQSRGSRGYKKTSYLCVANWTNVIPVKHSRRRGRKLKGSVETSHIL